MAEKLAVDSLTKEIEDVCNKYHRQKLDALRYRKLEARLMQRTSFCEDRFFVEGLILEGPTFDEAVDELPEPE